VAKTINVAGKSPSPKSFSGSSSGTSVTLSAGKYKVTGSGPSGYTTKYCPGCSGTASGGVPMKCTVTALFSQPTPYPGAKGFLEVQKIVKCPPGFVCPDPSSFTMNIDVSGGVSSMGWNPNTCRGVSPPAVSITLIYQLHVHVLSQ